MVVPFQQGTKACSVVQWKEAPPQQGPKDNQAPAKNLRQRRSAFASDSRVPTAKCQVADIRSAANRAL